MRLREGGVEDELSIWKVPFLQTVPFATGPMLMNRSPESAQREKLRPFVAHLTEFGVHLIVEDGVATGTRASTICPFSQTVPGATEPMKVHLPDPQSEKLWPSWEHLRDPSRHEPVVEDDGAEEEVVETTTGGSELMGVEENLVEVAFEDTAVELTFDVDFCVVNLDEVVVAARVEVLVDDGTTTDAVTFGGAEEDAVLLVEAGEDDADSLPPS